MSGLTGQALCPFGYGPGAESLGSTDLGRWVRFGLNRDAPSHRACDTLDMLKSGTRSAGVAVRLK